MAESIPFARPSIGAEEERGVLEVLRSGWLTTGRIAKQFEDEFSAHTRTPHCLAVSSATAGLHLALEAVGVRAGSQVITTPYTFAATSEVIRYLGAHPLFVDVEESTANIDPRRVDEAIRRTDGEASAVLPVHVAGLPCDMAGLREAAAGLPVVEDAAHRSPAPVGESPEVQESSGGDVRVYSFYATKTMTTGEGGMVCTARDELAARMRVMRLHGIDRDVWDRYTSAVASWRYDVREAGYKYNLPDLLAAVGVAQLRKVAAFRERRRAIAARYAAGLSDRDYLEIPPMCGEHDFHLYCLRIRPRRLRMCRDEIIGELARRGIGCSVHFIPLHLMGYYRRTYGLRPEDFPISLSIYERSISLPIYPGLGDDEVDRVVAEVRNIGDAAYRRTTSQPTTPQHRLDRPPLGAPLLTQAGGLRVEAASSRSAISASVSTNS